MQIYYPKFRYNAANDSQHGVASGQPSRGLEVNRELAANTNSSNRKSPPALRAAFDIGHHAHFLLLCHSIVRNL